MQYVTYMNVLYKYLNEISFKDLNKIIFYGTTGDLSRSSITTHSSSTQNKKNTTFFHFTNASSIPNECVESHPNPFDHLVQQHNYPMSVALDYENPNMSCHN